jgi:4-hydroxyphenylacetate 3-monooxygenase
VLIPWGNVFVYGDLEKASSFFPRSGFFPRAMFHGCDLRLSLIFSPDYF